MSTEKITPFLMFAGQAEAAMNFYLSVFDRSEIVQMQKYGPGQAGAEGTVVHATFRLNGQQFMAIDSSVKQPFTFTPALSFWIACETEAEIDSTFAKLTEGGAVLMPLGAYPFARKFAWVADKFGVTWQLALA